MHSGSHTLSRLIAALVVAVALVAPAQAGAAAAYISGGATLRVDGGSEASNLTVTTSGTNFVVADSGADVTAGPGCVQTSDSPKRVTCPQAGVTTVGSMLGERPSRHERDRAEHERQLRHRR
jgi:hypothetical protein